MATRKNSSSSRTQSTNAATNKVTKDTSPEMPVSVSTALPFTWHRGPIGPEQQRALCELFRREHTPKGQFIIASCRAELAASATFEALLRDLDEAIALANNLPPDREDLELALCSRMYMAGRLSMTTVDEALRAIQAAESDEDWDFDLREMRIELRDSYAFNDLFWSFGYGLKTLNRKSLLLDLSARLYIAGQIGATLNSNEPCIWESGELAIAFVEPFVKTQKAEIARNFLLQISSASSDADPKSPDYDGELAKNFLAFSFGASQATSDLALAAQYEADGILDSDNEEFFDLFRSPMYWKLRDTFIQQAAEGSTYALLFLVWRAYNAGRLSPRRFSPRNAQQGATGDIIVGTRGSSTTEDGYQLQLTSKEFGFLLEMILIETSNPIAAEPGEKLRTYILADRMRRMTDEKGHIEVWNRHMGEGE